MRRSKLDPNHPPRLAIPGLHWPERQTTPPSAPPVRRTVPYPSRVHLSFAVLLLSLFLCGCPADSRVKRQASLLNVKTATAAAEFKAAPTDADKVKVADEYFRSAPLMTQVVEDWFFNRKPQGPAELPAELPAEKKESPNE